MALLPFGGRNNLSLVDVFDPFEVMASMFDDTPATSFARNMTAVTSTSVDWKETPTEHIIKADLPGLKKEDVKVEIEDDRVLSISGQREKEEVQKGDTWHRVERTIGSFMRKFRLPDNAKVDQIKAKVDNGVLTVVVPKEEPKPTNKRIVDIGGHEGDCQDQQQIKSSDDKPAEGAAK